MYAISRTVHTPRDSERQSDGSPFDRRSPPDDWHAAELALLRARRHRLGIERLLGVGFYSVCLRGFILVRGVILGHGGRRTKLPNGLATAIRSHGSARQPRWFAACAKTLSNACESSGSGALGGNGTT